MRVSIITVAWNAAATIGDTLRSVAAQRYPDLEHLVIDGASTDETAAVFERTAGPRSTFFSAPDRGLYDAMNRGVAQASGDLVGFLNADDYFCRTDAVDLLAAGVAGGDAVSGGVAIVSATDTSRLRRAYPAAPFAPWMLRFGHMPPHPGFYARASAFAAVGEFDHRIRIGADFEWMIRFFAIHRLRAVTIPETIVTLREGGLSNDGFASRRRINREALTSLRSHGIASTAPVLWSKYLVKSLQLISRPHQWPAPTEVRWEPR